MHSLRCGASRHGIVATMELTEQRQPAMNMKQLAGCTKREPCSEIKILLAHAIPLLYPGDPLTAAGTGRLGLIFQLSNQDVRPSRSLLRFLRLFPLAPDRILNHERNNCARDSAGLLITVADLAIKMGITFAGLKFYSRRAAPP